MEIEKVYIFLTGGLGNQLFQVAAAKSLNPKEIKLITSVGNPRLNSEGKAEVLSLDIGVEISEYSIKHQNHFISKVFGYLLRSSILPTKFERLFSRIIFRWIAEKIINYEINDNCHIHYSEDIGYTPILRKSKNIFLIGYFQSYKYLDIVRSLYTNSNVSIFNEKLKLPIANIKFNYSKLIVHFRLGDYRNDKSFGVIHPSYYSIAINYLISKYYFDEIMIFSDEIDVARKLLKVEFTRQVTWVDPLEHNTYSSFQLMRTGKAFIIGNSTFSWWAASLAIMKPAIVVAPDPWFAGIKEPKNLIPDLWYRIPVRFLDS